MSIPLNEKQKAFLRKSRGVKQRFSIDKEVNPEVKRVRDYLGPVVASYAPPRVKWKGFSGSRLSPEIRAAVTARNVQRAVFFDGLKS